MTGHREDVERILSLCTVVVLCSDRNEGVPQAVLQAMACARPVVAAAAGDVPQVVRDGQTGLLVPPGEVEPLARAVQRLLEDAALRRRLGEAGRRLVEEHHSLAAMLAATEEVYARVLAGKGAKA
jgi:glycosyltransferase involved in cell wall biosynthesis